MERLFDLQIQKLNKKIIKMSKAVIKQVELISTAVENFDFKAIDDVFAKERKKVYVLD